jgi:hypothetical protein
MTKLTTESDRSGQRNRLSNSISALGARRRGPRLAVTAVAGVAALVVPLGMGGLQASASALATQAKSSARAETNTLRRVSNSASTANLTAVPHPIAAATSTSGLRSMAAWETLFQGRAARDDSQVYSPLSKSSDSWDYYNLAFGLDAYTSMYLATGKTAYLNQSLTYVNNVIARAKPSSSLGASAFGDSYLGWVSQRADVKGQEVPLFESFLWRYVTQMLWTIRQTPTLYNNPTYKNQYDRILAFTERNIFDKWYTRGDGPGGGGGAGKPNMYRQNTNMASHWAFISLLLSRMTSNTTRRSEAVTVYTDINHHMPIYGSSLRQQFIKTAAAPAAYEWSSAWGPAGQYVGAPNVQDVPHGSGEVSYIMASYDLGVEWTAADITALFHTLTDVVWRKDRTYAANVDGSGSGNGVIIDGFMKLGRYNAAIQQRLENYTGAISDNYYAVIDFYAQGALNARYLGA